jgi:hypothetical protein
MSIGKFDCSCLCTMLCIATVNSIPKEFYQSLQFKQQFLKLEKVRQNVCTCVSNFQKPKCQNQKFRLSAIVTKGCVVPHLKVLMHEPLESRQSRAWQQFWGLLRQLENYYFIYFIEWQSYVINIMHLTVYNLSLIGCYDMIHNLNENVVCEFIYSWYLKKIIRKESWTYYPKSMVF